MTASITQLLAMMAFATAGMLPPARALPIFDSSSGKVLVQGTRLDGVLTVTF